MKLTTEQVEALRAVPLGEMPNKVRLAITIARVRQGEAADAAQLSRAHLNEIVNGRNSNVTLKTARRLVHAFGCTTIDDLFPPHDTEAAA